ncbi:MAG: hypothetical protein WCD37_03370 [Chloroflexia bacterium]
MTVTIAKRITILLMAIWAVLAASLLGMGSRTAWAQSEPGRTIFGSDLTIEEGETVQGNVSVTGGDLVVYGTINGKAHVVDGDADIHGLVVGDLTIITGGSITLYEGSAVEGNVVASGDIDLQDNSRVEGSVTSLGGAVIQGQNALVGGTINKIDSPAQALQNFMNANAPHTPGASGNFGQHLSPFGRFFGWLSLGIFSAIVLALAVGLAALFPRRIRVSSATLEAEAGPSVVVGIITALLTFPLFGIASLVLAITIVGIVLIPVLAALLLIAFLFGFVVVSQWLGNRLYDTARHAESTYVPRQSQPATLIIEVLLGASVILASTVLPAIFLPGWITGMLLGIIYVISCIGIGSAVLSKFGTLQPPRRHPHRRTITYPTPVHTHANTQPLGPTPILPREE